MYIKYNGAVYPCKCKPGSTMIYRGLPVDFPAPVSGKIVLHADDGFILRTDKAEDYLRQTFTGGVLTLTNTPEPEIVEPEAPVNNPSVWDELDAAFQEGVNSAYDE